ncbi:unnamed protein product [Protopolystoma xenopodis]|uniref:Uncharacterized protein n=1 Tax=Protopolystoma xenopodis TaxID=117903 RepID=A0A3S5B4X2_9PLAT|nr:unnamed protein product [Protopolystoma xenopodis]
MWLCQHLIRLAHRFTSNQRQPLVPSPTSGPYSLPFTPQPTPTPCLKSAFGWAGVCYTITIALTDRLSSLRFICSSIHTHTHAHTHRPMSAGATNNDTWGRRRVVTREPVAESWTDGLSGGFRTHTVSSAVLAILSKAEQRIAAFRVDSFEVLAERGGLVRDKEVGEPSRVERGERRGVWCTGLGGARGKREIKSARQPELVPRASGD